MSVVNAYELEVLIGDERTKTTRSVARTEYAYDAIDAVKQAAINASVDIGPTEKIVKILKVGPPVKLIQATIAELDARIRAELDKIFKKA